MSDGESRAAGQPSARGSRESPDRWANRRFAVGLARACGGAVVFALPLLLTLEMWQLAFSIDRYRLVLLLLLTLPLLVGLSHFVGFERTFRLKDDAVDAFVAYAVGFVGAGAALFLLGVVGPDMAAGEVLGKVSLQAVPASIGALLAQSQLAGEDRGDREGRQPWNGHYARELFLMVVGALFLAMPVAR
jgi:putative integral membrane protein (TIGR02587 family)